MSKEKVNDEINKSNDESIDAKSENQKIESEVPESKKENFNYEEKIKSLENEIEKYKELALRKAAEFENYKRRTENDQLNLIKYAAETFIIKLLPTIDDLERSLTHMTEETDVEKIKEGIQLIYNKLIKTLNDHGVQKIEAVGQPFNVEFHEAIMQKNDDSVPPHTVLEEVETGYIFKDRVIRHSKVIVNGE